MENKIIQDLNTVIAVLNTVKVSEKQNYLNMGGSIDVLERIVDTLCGCKIIPKESQKTEKEEKE